MQHGRNRAHWAFGHCGNMQEVISGDRIKVTGVLDRRFGSGSRIESTSADIA